MEGLLQAQDPIILNQPRSTNVQHSRRTRRGHRSGLALAQWGRHTSPVQRLGGTQSPFEFVAVFERPVSKLEELKRRRFSVVGREERVAQSLDALREPAAVQLSVADWQWLNEHADLEDEFE
jgi:hypothetical protein